MNRPDLYVKHNRLQRQDATLLLEEYMTMVQWKNDGGDRIMDIGCGPGDVTVQILVPKLPDTVGEVIGTDLSPVMIEFARSHYQHPKVKYDVLDISNKNLPKVYYEHFNHVFSFHCLNWIQDRRQAIENIFRMLQPGGDVLLTYATHVPKSEVFMKVARRQFWQPHIPDARKYMPNYQHVPDMEDTVNATLREIGFEKITCSCIRQIFVYENFEKYKDAAIAVNALIQELPLHLRERYVAEYVNELKNHIYSEGFSDDGTEVKMPYTSIIINATKPS